MKEYIELFNAIWTRAVLDDTYRVVVDLRTTAFNRAYEYFLTKQTGIEKDDERFDTFKKELSEYCEIRVREIEQRIKELVYREAQDWPGNRNYKLRDKEYNTKLDELRAEVADYAEEKMSKRWYKI